jgi:hypothetical protein
VDGPLEGWKVLSKSSGVCRYSRKGKRVQQCRMGVSSSSSSGGDRLDGVHATSRVVTRVRVSGSAFVNIMSSL